MVKMPPKDAPCNKFFDRKEFETMVHSESWVQQLPREKTAEDRAKIMMSRNNAMDSVALLSVKGNGDIILTRYKRTGTTLLLWNFGQS